AALLALALVLEAPELLLQPVGGEVDRDLRFGRLLAAHQLVMIEPQRDLRAVTVALGGHRQVGLADVARELAELLETLLGVEPDARIELTVTRRGDDLHLIPHAAGWDSSPPRRRSWPSWSAAFKPRAVTPPGGGSAPAGC